MTCDPADGCGTSCRDCGRSWCRAEEASPGEADGLCVDCADDGGGDAA